MFAVMLGLGLGLACQRLVNNVLPLKLSSCMSHDAFDCTVLKVKQRIVLREIHPRTTGRHLSNGITQCYLLPDRGGRPAFTPTGQVGTRFIDPVRMKGWVGLGMWMCSSYATDWTCLLLTYLLKLGFMPSFANLRPWFYPLKCEALALIGLEDLWPWPSPWPCIAWPWPWPRPWHCWPC